MNRINLLYILLGILLYVFLLNFAHTKENNSQKMIDNKYYIILIIKYLLIIVFSIIFNNNINVINTNSTILIFITLIIPISFSLIHDYNDYIHFVNTDIIEEEREFLLNEIESENAISIIIPGILFGIGSIVGGIIYNKKFLLNIVTPYLITSLLFGTIIPMFIQLFIDKSNILTLLKIEQSIASFDILATFYLGYSILLVYNSLV